jgi:hypothetical protein
MAQITAFNASLDSTRCDIESVVLQAAEAIFDYQRFLIKTQIKGLDLLRLIFIHRPGDGQMFLYHVVNPCL